MPLPYYFPVVDIESAKELSELLRKMPMEKLGVTEFEKDVAVVSKSDSTSESHEP